MDIKRNGSRPSTKAPDTYFSGAVRVEPVFQVGDPVRFADQGGRAINSGRSATCALDASC
jgi:hypothetical protein